MRRRYFLESRKFYLNILLIIIFLIISLFNLTSCVDAGHDYYLEVVGGHGSISTTLGEKVYTEANSPFSLLGGSRQLRIIAIPDEGYRIKEWKYNREIITDNKTNELITSYDDDKNGNTYISVEFEPTPEPCCEFCDTCSCSTSYSYIYTYELKIMDDMLGKVSIEKDGKVLNAWTWYSHLTLLGGKIANHKLTMVAKPNPGYQVKEWIYNGIIVEDNKTNVLVTQPANYTNRDINIIVVFEEVPVAA